MPFTPEQEAILKQTEAASKAERMKAAQDSMDSVPIIGPFNKFTREMQTIFTSAVTRGGSEHLTALMKGDTVDEERKITAQMKADNPISGKVADFAGTVAPMLALPNPASIAGAAGMGAAVSGGDNILNHAMRGEMPGAGELAATTGIGAVAGIFGRYFGNTVQDYMKKAGLDTTTPLTKIGKNVVEERKAIEDTASAAMDASGVVISKQGVQDLANNALKTATDAGLDKVSTKGAWRAAQMLAAVGSRGEDLSLRALNNLRINIRDSLPAGASDLNARVVGTIGKEIDAFMQRLPTGKAGVVIAGDAQAGVAAWQSMNALHQDVMRGQALSNLFYRSELEASKRGAGKSLGQTLQDNAATFLTRTSGKAMDELSLFRPHEIKALEDLVQGNWSVGFDGIIEKYLGSNVLAAPFKAAIRGTAATVNAATGGGDVGTRAAALRLLGEGGASVSIPNVVAPLTAPAAAMAERLTKQYNDHENRINMILDQERLRAQPFAPRAPGVPIAAPAAAAPVAPVPAVPATGAGAAMPMGAPKPMVSPQNAPVSGPPTAALPPSLGSLITGSNAGGG